MTATLCLGIGILIGYSGANKASQYALRSARAKGLWDGREEREIEVQLLRRRITHLECQVREIEAQPNGVRV
jgi:hypothetical protein